MLRRIQVLFHVFRELPEGISGRIDGIFKGADFHFVLVAGIHQHHIRIGNQFVPFFRIHIRADNPLRINTVHTHGDDLFLELHFGAFERLDVHKGLFVINAVEPLVAGDPVFHGINAFAAAGNGAVDALARQQQSAVHVFLEHQVQQRLAEGFIIIQDCELVQCADNNVVAHHFLLRAGP